MSETTGWKIIHAIAALWCLFFVLFSVCEMAFGDGNMYLDARPHREAVPTLNAMLFVINFGFAAASALRAMWVAR